LHYFRLARIIRQRPRVLWTEKEEKTGAKPPHSKGFLVNHNRYPSPRFFVSVAFKGFSFPCKLFTINTYEVAHKC
jgi:hypothetical protein